MGNKNQSRQAGLATRPARKRRPDGTYAPSNYNGEPTAVAPKKRTRKVTPAPVPQAVQAAEPPQQSAEPKPKLRNHIALVVDKSYSMSHLRQQVVNVFNSFATTVRGQAAEQGQDTTISLSVFSNNVRPMFVAADVQTLKPLTLDLYQPDGNTALFDGVGLTIEALERLKDAKDEHTSFLLIAITDGEENRSVRYNKHRLREKLLELDKDGRWTVAFHLPRGAASSFCANFGIPRENVREWETTEKGIQEAGQASDQGLGAYFDARAQGHKRVEKFFADLSKVTDAEVRAKLVNFGKQYKQYTVDKEMSIKEFVEEKTNKPYVIGSAFYELTKPETVQPQKDVLILERGREKQAVYGGPAARHLLGLPQGVSAKLTPANLSKWRPCVKSTSVNRKLVRGTVVLVDTTKVMPDDPTWDHTQGGTK